MSLKAKLILTYIDGTLYKMLFSVFSLDSFHKYIKDQAVSHMFFQALSIHL